DSSSGEAASSSDTGNVALMLTDGPADDYDHIWIKISRAELLPSDSGSQVVIFDPDEPVEYDLLNLRPEEEGDAGALLTLTAVPVGAYSKIRLEVESVRGVKIALDGSIETTEFRLPSGKIDLNPRGSFQVTADITIAVTLDIDCNKSIHVSGNHKNFRPVVFVNVEPLERPQLCPRVLHGTIASLTTAEDPATPAGFTLTLPGCHHGIQILLDDNTVVIDAQGNLVDAQALKAGDSVHVRGRLQEGGLLAEMVVVGDVDLFAGTVVQGVSGDQFEFDRYLDDTAEPQVVSLIPGKTLILWGCEGRLTPDSIQPGMHVRVLGKAQEDGTIVAVAVLLRPQWVTGMLTAMAPTDNGYTLTVNTQPESATPSITTLFLPNWAIIHPQFDGILSAATLAEWVECQPRSVYITVAPTQEPSLTATWVTVQAETLQATVSEVNSADRLLVTDAGSVHVGIPSCITDLTLTDGPLAVFSDIAPGDALVLYGFTTCPIEPDTATFEAYVASIVPPDSSEE
ncbi:MAG: DUF4382 domain-containing protein, partial [Desulfatitalea sp.]